MRQASNLLHVFIPAKLCCGVSSVAIRAQHSALCNLTLDFVYRVMPHERHLNELFSPVDVIKLKDNWVGLSAAFTRALSQVVEYELPVSPEPL